MANKKKRCTYCKEYYPAENEIKTPAGGFCSITHAKEYGTKNSIKLKAKKAKDKTKASKAALRELNRKDLKWQHKQTQTVFNRMIVAEELNWFAERGLEPTCISCGKPNMDWCAGHLKSRGAQPGLRYDRLNVRLQCNRYCNMALSGNISGNKNTHGYTQGLINRFGEAEATRMIDYCESNTAPVKWEWQKLEDFRAECNEIIRDLKSINN